MKTVRLIAAAAAAVLFAVPLAARAEGEQPTPAEIARVMDYFNNGKGKGPVLTAFKACVDIDTAKNSATRFECTQEVSGPVKKGSMVHAWTSWFVPQGDQYDDISVRYLLDGAVRSTQDVSVATAYRTRIYKSLNLSKAGTWEIQIVRGEKVLSSTKVTVE